MSGSFVSQDGKTHRHAGWHMTPHTHARKRGKQRNVRSSQAMLSIPSRQGHKTRYAGESSSQPSNICLRICAGTIRSQRHACVKKISAARGAELVGTQLLSPAPVPSASSQDVHDLAQAQTPGPPAAGWIANFFCVWRHGDRRDDVYGKSLPAWTERRVRTRRSGAKPSGISCHYSCTTTCCREPQGRAVI